MVLIVLIVEMVWLVWMVPMKFASLILCIFHGINLDGLDRFDCWIVQNKPAAALSKRFISDRHAGLDPASRSAML